MNNCPICGKSLVSENSNVYNVVTKCSNGCYCEKIKVSHESKFRVEVFENIYLFDLRNAKEVKKDIQKDIDYWKENERYLMRLMLNSQE